MKKRMFVCFFIFIISVLHLLIPSVVFGKSLATQVFEKHEELFLREDVRLLLPDVLIAFGEENIQPHLNHDNIDGIANTPATLRSVDPNMDDRFIGLLYADSALRALFRDKQFQTLLQTPAEINKLVKLIPDPQGTTCPLPLQPEPKTLRIVSGNSQSTDIGKTLAQPFVVGVLDQDNKPLKMIKVTFTTPTNGGHLSGYEIHTDEYGQARTTLTLGSRVGTHSVTASAEGITQKQTFTATATPLIKSDVSEPKLVLNRISGHHKADDRGKLQEGELEKQLDLPFIVRVVDENDNNEPPHGIHGIGVTFQVTKGGGQLSDKTAITNEKGYAEVFLTLGSQAGENRVRASAVGVSGSPIFTATAKVPEEKGTGFVLDKRRKYALVSGCRGHREATTTTGERLDAHRESCLGYGKKKGILDRTFTHGRAYSECVP